MFVSLVVYMYVCCCRYGELSNQALVHKYGFCLRSNPFDEVDLGPGWPWLLKEVAAAAGLSKRLKQPVAWLERNR
jgi:hypothetical protein